jgi:hypothetical protein
LVGVTTAAGDLVTATATVKTGASTYGRTSEFSANQIVNPSAAPVLSFVSGSYNHPENAGPIVVAPSASVSDADSPNFAGGRAVVYFPLNGQPDDRIAIRHQGTRLGQIGLSGSAVLYGGAVIGTWTGGTDGSTPLIVSFNAMATPGAAQALLRNITYANVSDNPSAVARTMAGYLEDGAGGTSNTVSGTIRVVPSNDAPVAHAGSAYTLAEGASLTLDASASFDLDNAVLAYAWDLDQDGVYGETGEPTASTATVDWATLGVLGLTDSGSYAVGLRVTDGLGASSVSMATLTITDSAPVLTLSGTGRVTAGQPYTLNLSASDSGADTITAWSIDWGDGTVTTHGGNPASVVHTYTRSGGTFSVLATVTDEDGSHAQTLLQAHQVVVDNAAPVLTSDGGGASAAFALTENTAAVTTVTASDADQPAQTLTYSIAGGADAARFAIDAATGALRFVTAPDHEAPSEAGTDNVYDVTVQVSDGGLQVTQTLLIRVTGVNDNAPRLIVQSGSVQIEVATQEGARWSMLLDATDADLPTQGLTFAITGGADADLFALDPVSGLLTFKPVVDHEAPQDATQDNAYEVEIEVGDGTLAEHRTVVLRVANVNEAPMLLNSQIAVEQGGQVVLDGTMFSASDPDTTAATLVYTVSEVQSGVFEQVDAPGQAVSEFTQADVTAGRVVFVQFDVRIASASFTLTVSDGALTVGPRRVVVQVQPTPEQTVQSVADQPVFEGVSVSVRFGDALTMVNDRTRLDQIMVEIAGSAVKPDSASAVSGDLGSETPATTPLFDRSALAVLTPVARPSGQSDDASAPPRNRLITTAEPARGLDPVRQTASDLLVMLDVPIDLSGFVQERAALLQWASVEERSRAVAESALQQKAKDEAPDLQWDSGTTLQVGSMALSVGLVFWATRATGLVASLLAVAPPWRAFDPLPVLSVHAPRQPEGTEVEWLDTDITGSLAELAEDILDQRP